MVPAIAFGVAQVQETQSEAPACVRCGQSQQPVGNQLILAAALAGVSVARGADVKCLTGDALTDGVLLNGFVRHLTFARWP